MTRLNIATALPFDEFRAAFEQAAPAFDPAIYQPIIDSRGNWEDVRAVVDAHAPHALMRYATIDATDMLGLAGHRTKTVEYLLGNHVIAETMFRHDPNAMLYAPLRVLVFSDAADEAVFAIDQPSTVFHALGHPEIAAVGVELDDKVSALLRAIGVGGSPLG